MCGRYASARSVDDLGVRRSASARTSVEPTSRAGLERRADEADRRGARPRGPASCSRRCGGDLCRRGRRPVDRFAHDQRAARDRRRRSRRSATRSRRGDASSPPTVGTSGRRGPTAPGSRTTWRPTTARLLAFAGLWEVWWDAEGRPLRTVDDRHRPGAGGPARSCTTARRSCCRAAAGTAGSTRERAGRRHGACCNRRRRASSSRAGRRRRSATCDANGPQLIEPGRRSRSSRRCSERGVGRSYARPRCARAGLRRGRRRRRRRHCARARRGRSAAGRARDGCGARGDDAGAAPSAGLLLAGASPGVGVPRGRRPSAAVAALFVGGLPELAGRLDPGAAFEPAALAGAAAAVAAARRSCSRLLFTDHAGSSAEQVALQFRPPGSPAPSGRLRAPSSRRSRRRSGHGRAPPSSRCLSCCLILTQRGPRCMTARFRGRLDGGRDCPLLALLVACGGVQRRRRGRTTPKNGTGACPASISETASTQLAERRPATGRGVDSAYEYCTARRDEGLVLRARRRGRTTSPDLRDAYDDTLEGARATRSRAPTRKRTPRRRPSSRVRTTARPTSSRCATARSGCD